MFPAWSSQKSLPGVILWRIYSYANDFPSFHQSLPNFNHCSTFPLNIVWTYPPLSSHRDSSFCLPPLNMKTFSIIFLNLFLLTFAAASILPPSKCLCPFPICPQAEPFVSFFFSLVAMAILLPSILLSCLPKPSFWLADYLLRQPQCSTFSSSELIR